MKNILFTILCVFLALSTSLAQTEMSIFQVQIGAYSQDVEQSKFNNLVDLGLIHFQSIDPERADPPEGIKRAFLGRYLDLSTAEYILAEVKRRGYTKAFLEQDKFTLNSDEGKFVTLAVQVGAFTKVNMRRFEGLGNTIYVVREKGLFKILLGVYPQAFRTYLEQKIIPLVEDRNHSAIITTIR